LLLCGIKCEFKMKQARWVPLLLDVDEKALMAEGVAEF
jgi:hypothetical protein